MNIKYIKYFAGAFIAFLLIPAGQIRAAEFDPSFILTNSDVEDSQALSLTEIQNFLVSQRSYLANLVADDFMGVKRSAAELIYNAGINNGINPKWILVTLQKEQSLINASNPTASQLDWAMGYGVCDDCAKDDPAIQKFKGFGNQVERAAARVRYYINNPEKFNFRAGITKTIDNVLVSIKNMATAILYNYTPHIHGNFNFWKIWSRWFALIYPDGSLVQVQGEPEIWYLQNGQRRLIVSKAVFASRFNKKDVLTVSKFDLEQYDQGPDIKFVNYSLVKSPDSTTYLLVGNEKKKFESVDVFRRLGFNPEEVDEVSYEDLLPYSDGHLITLSSAYPLGQLIQDIKTGGVYFVQDGFKYPIIRKEILTVNFAGKKIIKGDEATLAKFITAEKVKFQDGQLVKTKDDPSVYVISNGVRRKIANEATFKRLGYKFKDVITTTEEALSLHMLGVVINSVIDSTLPPLESLASSQPQTYVPTVTYQPAKVYYTDPIPTSIPNTIPH